MFSFTKGECNSHAVNVCHTRWYLFTWGEIHSYPFTRGDWTSPRVNRYGCISPHVNRCESKFLREANWQRDNSSPRFFNIPCKMWNDTSYDSTQTGHSKTTFEPPLSGSSSSNRDRVEMQKRWNKALPDHTARDQMLERHVISLLFQQLEDIRNRFQGSFHR